MGRYRFLKARRCHLCPRLAEGINDNEGPTITQRRDFKNLLTPHKITLLLLLSAPPPPPPSIKYANAVINQCHLLQINCTIQTTVGTITYGIQRTHWIIVLLALLDVVILFILGHHGKVYGATRKVTPRQNNKSLLLI